MEKLKKKLNLISIQKDLLNEKEKSNVFGGRHCGQTCGKKGSYNPQGLDYADNTNYIANQMDWKA